MLLYRIAKQEYIGDLSGTGAKLYGGRWNKPGKAALYTSESRALAMLELLVHFNSRAAIRNVFRFAVIEVDSTLITDVPAKLFPDNLHTFNNETLWEITEKYFDQKNCLAIRVPSVIIGRESNVILNPEHENYPLVRITSVEKAAIDPRLLK